jgi:hypothetical protein
MLSGIFGSCAGSLVQNVGVPSNRFGNGSYLTSSLFASDTPTPDNSKIAKITEIAFFSSMVWRLVSKKTSPAF